MAIIKSESSKKRLQDLLNYTSSSLLVVFALISVVINIWQADKGIVTSDEGWYLYLLKYKPDGLSTQFYNLIPNIFQGDIQKIRLLVIFVNIIATIIFCWGLFLFFRVRFNLKKNHFIFLVSLSLISIVDIGLFCFTYFVINKFILLVSIGLILWGLSSKSNLIRKILLVVAGYFLGNLFFVMVTNTIIIPISFIFVYILSDKKVKIKNLLFLLIGIIMTFTLYFMFIESFSVYVNNFISQFHNVSTSTHKKYRYDLISLFTWLIHSFHYFIYDIFPGVFGLLGVYYFANLRKISLSLKLFLLIVASIFFVLYLKYNLFESHYIIIPNVSTFFIIYSFLILFSLINSRLKREELSVFSFVFIVPILLTFGTNTSFDSRVSEYICFLIPLMFILFKINNFRFIYYFSFSLIISIYFIWNIGKYDKPHLVQQVYTQQTYSVKQLGIKQNLKLDKHRYEILKELKLYIGEGDFVIAGDCGLWGYLYLIDAVPISYEFRLDEKQQLVTIANCPSKYKNIKCVAFNYAPFEIRFINEVKSNLVANTVIVQKFTRGVVYSFK